MLIGAVPVYAASQTLTYKGVTGVFLDKQQSDSWNNGWLGGLAADSGIAVGLAWIAAPFTAGMAPVATYSIIGAGATVGTILGDTSNLGPNQCVTTTGNCVEQVLGDWFVYPCSTTHSQMGRILEKYVSDGQLHKLNLNLNGSGNSSLN
jgi:hypothetical protein